MFSIKLFLILIVFYLQVLGKVFPMEYSNDTIDRSAADKCGFGARDKCIEPMKKYLSVKHISYGKNENELTEVCKKIQKVITCFDEYLESCKTISARIRDKVHKLLIGHRSLQSELCDENSPLRQKYLGFAHCIEHNSKDTIQCFKNYEKEMIDTMSEINFQSQKFGYIQMDSICCALQRHNLCTRIILESRCNTTAADLSEQLFLLARSDISHDCRPNPFGHCSGTERLFAMRSVHVMTLLLLILLLLRFDLQ